MRSRADRKPGQQGDQQKRKRGVKNGSIGVQKSQQNLSKPTLPRNALPHQGPMAPWPSSGWVEQEIPKPKKNLFPD
jgi:hypothetical protein